MSTSKHDRERLCVLELSRGEFVGEWGLERPRRLEVAFTLVQVFEHKPRLLVDYLNAACQAAEQGKQDCPVHEFLRADQADRLLAAGLLTEDGALKQGNLGYSGVRQIWMPEGRRLTPREESRAASGDRSARGPRKRRPIPLSVRFVVLRRDGFRCVYCGATPDETGLHIDHVNPVSAGGTNEVSNLVTSCIECNLGKGATTSLEASEGDL